MKQFPELEIPDIQKLSKEKSWNPKKYQPLIYNEEIKKKAETLKPGSLEYDDFWDEMDYYCYNGFQPKGMPRITGRHFYYLNFCRIDMIQKKGDKRKKLSAPFYRDLDHWLFLELESAIEHGHGLLITKPRRIGLSEFGAVNCNYELTFYQRNKIGICAGKDDKAQEFYDKLKSSLENVHPAYQNGNITNNSNELRIGYEERINKKNKQLGLNSVARIKTMYADSSAFEGGSYSMVIFEEAGLFENLTASYAATKPCFMDGANQFGIPIIYGTGGEIDKGAKGFKTMWDKYAVYNIKPIFVPAHYYYPGDNIPDEKTGKTISFFDREKGVTDQKAARKYIEAERKIAEKSKETYTKHVQSYPLHPKEVFLKTKGGVLDIIKLNFQVKRINAGEEPEPVLQGRLDWVDTPETTALLQRAKTLKEKTKIRVKNGSKVKFVIDENGTVWKDSNPINPNVTHLSYKPDIGACDSYDEEVDEKKIDDEQVSSGCVMAYRCFSGPIREFNKPVGLLFERGDASFDDDVFYENAVKFAIYWDIEILFEYTKFHIIRYFYDVGAHKYVKARPMLEEAGTDRHHNKDGVKMTTQVKTVVTKMLKSEVKDNIHKCFFLNIILDLMNYGDVNTDIAMTYGIALLHRMDIFEEITEDIEVDYTQQRSHLPTQSYYVDMHGNLRVDTFGEKDVLDTFIPERDMSALEYQNYIEKREQKNKMVEKQYDKYAEKAAELGVDKTVLSMVLQEIENAKNNN